VADAEGAVCVTLEELRGMLRGAVEAGRLVHEDREMLVYICVVRKSARRAW